MAEPILIVHGVANHEPKPFYAQVAKLQSSLDARWQLVPVFWGDQGGKATDIEDVLPQMTSEVRSLAATDLPPGLLESLFALPVGQTDGAKSAVRSQNEQKDYILRGVSQTQPSLTQAVRGSVSDPIAEAVREQLPQTRFLRHVRSPDVLEAIGRTLGQTVPETITADSNLLQPTPRPLVRSGSAGSVETRALFDGIKKRAKSVLNSLDELIGQTVGDVLGNFNQRLRGAIAEPFVRFFGDIFAYQSNQIRIQEELWKAIASWEKENGDGGVGWGTASRPIRVIAHSLGGLVCFDAAVRESNPLHMKSFLTFGSQAAFFHVVDPRHTLTTYSNDKPVTLPTTIPRWTSLWDTMDFLAFTAGTVFQYPGGEKPQDIRVSDPISLIIADKGWTHSIYWETEELQQALQDMLKH